MSAAEFVGHLFLARDVAHSTHLNTRSYAKHVALAEFYEGIVPLADKFAEAHQARSGLMGPIPLLKIGKTTNVVEFLRASLKQIEGARYECCDKADTPLQNIIDEIVGLYLSTLYKLEFLS